MSKINESLVRKVPLSENGSVLPIGIRDSTGQIDRTLASREWRMKEERELGAAVKRIKETELGKYISTVLSVLCTKVGPYDFESLKTPERAVHISSMWMADVFFAYLCLRVQSIGDKLELTVTCDKCGASFPFVADLNTVSIRSVEKYEDALWDYEVVKPFTMRGKEVKKIKMGPARWSTMEQVGADSISNFGMMKATMLSSSIHSVEGIEGNFIFVPDDLNDMRKIDIERLTELLDVNSLGPDMSIEDQCSNCLQDFRSSITWGTGGFFGVSLK